MGSKYKVSVNNLTELDITWNKYNQLKKIKIKINMAYREVDMCT